MEHITKMGGIGALFKFLPGMGRMREKAVAQATSFAGGAQVIRRQLAIISSMTPWERLNPEILNASRKRRIAGGSGTSVPAINRLLKQYEQMTKAVKQIGKPGLKKFLPQGFNKFFSVISSNKRRTKAVWP